MSIKSLPKSITSYDLFKALAVLTMVLDHIGIYFFPDEMWWRVFGRLSFPVWLFLVGYARSRDLSPRLMIGAGIVFVSNIVAGQGIFPINILLTILLVRMLLDPMMARLSKKPAHLWASSIVLFLLAVPTFALVEFGTQALILAAFGYLVRHAQEYKSGDLVFKYTIFTAFQYIIIQSVGYGMSVPMTAVLAIGIAVITYASFHFELKTYDGLTAKLPGPLVGLLQLCGRRTLEIYVAHLLLFKALALYVGTEGFRLFQWSWTW